MSYKRRLASVILSLCAFALACPQQADALDCGTRTWRNFERTDGDPQQQRRDAEARAALARLGPIVFRGRLASARDLSDVRKPVNAAFLFVFKDVEVLRGEMPRSVQDRRAFLVYQAWRDGRCTSASQFWGPNRGSALYTAYPSKGGPVKEDLGGGKVVYRGRVDAEWSVCGQTELTPLQEQLLKAPADEIARLMREYPFHYVRDTKPADPN